MVEVDVEPTLGGSGIPPGTLGGLFTREALGGAVGSVGGGTC